MFNPHGSYKIRRRGNVLVIDICGAWNFETAIKYQEESKLVVRPLIKKPWAVLSNISDWELCTPECEPIMAKLYRGAAQIGLVREAIINESGLIKLEQLKRISPDVEGIHQRIFPTQDLAVEWLSEQGFDLQLEDD